MWHYVHMMLHGGPQRWFVLTWVLASVFGGLLGVIGIAFTPFGMWILFGGFVGTVQTIALLVHRIKPTIAAQTWAPASCLGWFLGVFIVGSTLFVMRPPDSEEPTLFMFGAGWVGAAILQGLLLTYVVYYPGAEGAQDCNGDGGRRSSRQDNPGATPDDHSVSQEGSPPGMLPLLVWFPVSVLGGGVLAGFLGSMAAKQLIAGEITEAGLLEGPGSALYQMSPLFIAGGVSGLAYGLSTGFVLLWLLRSIYGSNATPAPSGVRRSQSPSAQRRPPGQGHPPGGASIESRSSSGTLRQLLLFSGLVVILSIVFGGLLWLSGGLSTVLAGCNEEEYRVYAEFDQYGSHQPQLYSNPESGTCSARFTARTSEKELLSYYEKRLEEHGWSVTVETSRQNQQQSESDIVPTALLRAERDGFSYTVRFEVRDADRKSIEIKEVRTSVFENTIRKRPELNNSQKTVTLPLGFWLHRGAD